MVTAAIVDFYTARQMSLVKELIHMGTFLPRVLDAR